MVENENRAIREVLKPEQSVERIEKGLTQDTVAPPPQNEQLPPLQQTPVSIQEGLTMDTIAPPPPFEPPDDAGD